MIRFVRVAAIGGVAQTLFTDRQVCQFGFKSQICCNKPFVKSCGCASHQAADLSAHELLSPDGLVRKILAHACLQTAPCDGRCCTLYATYRDAYATVACRWSDVLRSARDGMLRADRRDIVQFAERDVLQERRVRCANRSLTCASRVLPHLCATKPSGAHVAEHTKGNAALSHHTARTVSAHLCPILADVFAGIVAR